MSDRISRDSSFPVIQILLVEDTKSDAYFLQETLKESQIPHHLFFVKDGVEALDFLYKRGKYTHVSRPDLIFLDLNMPRKNGWEVLAELKADEALSAIPVVVITTSNNEEDMAKIYQLQADRYLVKPVEIDQLLLIMRGVTEI